MRVIYGIVRYWHNLYASTSLANDRQLLPNVDFVNSKLVAKCNRQLIGKSSQSADTVTVLTRFPERKRCTGEFPASLTKMLFCHESARTCSARF